MTLSRFASSLSSSSAGALTSLASGGVTTPCVATVVPGLSPIADLHPDSRRRSPGRFIVGGMRAFLSAAGLALTLSTAAHLLAFGSTADAEKYWPQWRGPEATGVARHADPPLEWSETKNVRWKKEIPGRGSASPV